MVDPTPKQLIGTVQLRHQARPHETFKEFSANSLDQGKKLSHRRISYE